MTTIRNLVLLLLVPGLLVGSKVAVRPARDRGVPQSADDRAAKVCEVASPTASFSVPYVPQAPELNTDLQSSTWTHAASAWIIKDCTHEFDYPRLKTEVRAFWTDSDLYLLFISPYIELNLWLPA